LSLFFLCESTSQANSEEQENGEGFHASKLITPGRN
jgi:hypothetical protein